MLMLILSAAPSSFLLLLVVLIVLLNDGLAGLRCLECSERKESIANKI